MKTTNYTSSYYSIFMSKYSLLAICSILFFSPTANAQVSVIGHASAEVVEIASIHSDAITELSINTASPNINSDLDLGTITVKSSGSNSCDVMVIPATLINKSGASIKLEASANNLSKENSTQLSNNRTLALTGNTTVPKGEAGLYQGSYTIVLAYN